MPVSASLGSKQEDVNHYGAVRLRVNGTGTLRLRFVGLDAVSDEILVPMTMVNAPGREPRVLANFIGQRAQIELKTVNIGELMHINRIIVFAKPLWSEYPA